MFNPSFACSLPERSVNIDGSLSRRQAAEGSGRWKIPALLSGSLRFHQKTNNDVQKQMLNAKSIGMFHAKPEASIEIPEGQAPYRKWASKDGLYLEEQREPVRSNQSA